MAYQPKSYRKFVATAATATLVASAVVPAVSAASVSDFKDVPAKYQDAVKYLVDNGISQGTTATTFGTSDNVKRGDAAIWLTKALGLDTTNAAPSGFADTGRYDAAVSVLKAKNILGGKTATTFEPNSLLTRGEMAKILANAYNLQSDAAVPFTDLGPNFGSYIKALYAFEITGGKTPTTFGTSENITRGDLAIFLKRAAEVKVDPAVVSVSAINGTKLEVKFNRALDKNTISIGDFTVTPLDGQGALTGLVGTLSDDGKTYTIETAAGQYFTKRYDVKLTDKTVKSTDGKDVAEYITTITVDDKTAPVITGTSFTQAGAGKVNVTVNFDEQLQTVGIVSVNGNTVTPTFSPNTKTMTLPGLDAGKTYKIDVVGAKDVAGNLANPLSTSVSTSLDAVAPTVAVTVTEATIKLDFSEEVDDATANKFVVTVNGGSALTPVQNATDKTIYTVNASSALGTSTFLNGAKIKVASIYDLAGNKAQDVEVTANLVKDTTAPKFVSATTEGAKLVLKYDEAIQSTTAANIDETDLTIKYVDKDGVQHTLAGTDFTATTVHGYDLNGNTTTDVGTDEEKYVVITLAEATGGAKDFIDASGKLVQGTYTVTVAKDQLEDVAGNKVVASTFSVVVGSGIVAKTVTYTANNTGLANNQLKVVYSEAMSNDALDASKYTLGGVALPTGTTLTFVDSKANVLITLPEGYLTVNGPREVKVSGVTALDGDTQKVTGQTQQIVTFKENVAPVASTVSIVDDAKAVVDFSEAVTGDTTTGIKVKLNGIEVTPALTVASGDLNIAFVAGTLKATDKVTVEFSGSVLVDAAGNKVKDGSLSN